MTKYISVLSFCFLAACAQNLETPPEATPQTVPISENSAPALEPVVDVIEEDPILDQMVQPEPEPEPAVAPDAAPKETIPEEVAVIEIKVDNNPDQFLGAGLELISERIGAPYFARRDGAIEVWQYQRNWQEGKCHLDLFLYPSTVSDGSRLKVKYTELRSQFLSRPDQRNCFAEMLRDQIRHHSTPTS